MNNTFLIPSDSGKSIICFLHYYIKECILPVHQIRRPTLKKQREISKFSSATSFKNHTVVSSNKCLLTCLWWGNRGLKTERTLSCVMADFECNEREDILYSHKIIKPKYNELHFYVYHKNTFKFVYTKRRCKYQSKYLIFNETFAMNKAKCFWLFFLRNASPSLKSKTELKLLLYW